MGIIYSSSGNNVNPMSCYEHEESCVRSCAAPAQCVYTDRCGDSTTNAHYACMPFDGRFLASFMWILVAVFLIVVLCCSALVVFYAIRLIRRSFRNPIQTDGDIVFYNARNVHNFPHPAATKYADEQEYNMRRDGRYY